MFFAFAIQFRLQFINCPYSNLAQGLVQYESEPAAKRLDKMHNSAPGYLVNHLPDALYKLSRLSRALDVVRVSRRRGEDFRRWRDLPKYFQCKLSNQRLDTVGEVEFDHVLRH